MKIYDVVVPKKYTKNGAEKTNWNNVGKLIKFDADGEKPEGFILELNMFPETKFGIFEQKPKTPPNQVQTPPDGKIPVQTTQDPLNVAFWGSGEVNGEQPPKEEEIKVEEIPF